LALEKKIAVLIVAGGRGSRAGNADLPKQYRAISGIPILSRTINQFLKMQAINFITPVIHKDDAKLFNNLHLEAERLLPFVFGGKTRQLSVLAGLKALEKHEPDYVLIHDGARPFITEQVVNDIIAALKDNEAALPATNVIDSIKRSSDGRTVGGSEDRTQLFAAQTPQGFHYRGILKAHKKLSTLSDDFTDDAAIAEWAKIPVVLTKGDVDNFKITSFEDFARAERFLGEKQLMETRVGSGYDVHRFEEGNGVILGGIKIPHTAKLKGHSDADTALHVLSDAIFGALADGDIGTHFPPSEEKWKGESSDTFLKYAVERVKKRQGRIVHLDLTINCELPKIAPHTMDMRKSIANICSININRISVKATTSEGMGFIGRGEGIATYASATIELPSEE
jgi:2-C-methyl-D-erythritol 4-phosphate cytidylyltransferase/2-C-methyl-D-erythritol 2,4-cyclodiphosphate synthase